MCEEENNVRKVYQIDVPDHKIYLDCESTGQETILNMIENRFQMHDVKNLKLKFENMLFMDSNNSCLNVGLPVGVLSTEETYICKFKKTRVWHPSNLRRHYAVDKYVKNWVMGHFFASKEEIPSRVSRFTKIIPFNMKVDFFNGETLFQALVRDGRFVEEELRFCSVKCDGKQSGLSYIANNYQGKSIQIYSTKQKDASLPESIPPRPYPDANATNVKVEPSEMQETGLAIAGPSTLAPQASSSPSEITSGSAKSRMSKECNFALKQGDNTLFVRDAVVFTEIAEIAKSVGAIFIKNSEFIGTCIRIGTQYIITNNHVIQEIEKRCTTAAEVVIDFNFMEDTPDPSKPKYKVVIVPVIRSEQLDYGILELTEPPNKLPPCIFQCGVSLMDPNNSDWSLLKGQYLRFIGHPNGQAKLIDLKCPVVTTLQDGQNDDFHHFHDQRRGLYHVSNFFHGSSGSPGILLLSSKKLLVILHTKGIRLNDSNSVEQGILFTEIYNHVLESIKRAQQDPRSGQNALKDVKIEDIFPSVEGAEPMDIDDFSN